MVEFHRFEPTLSPPCPKPPGAGIPAGKAAFRAAEGPDPCALSNMQSSDRFFHGKPAEQMFPESEVRPPVSAQARCRRRQRGGSRLPGGWGSWRGCFAPAGTPPRDAGGHGQPLGFPIAAPTFPIGVMQRLRKIRVNFDCFGLKKMPSRKGNLEKTKEFFPCLRMNF